VEYIFPYFLVGFVILSSLKRKKVQQHISFIRNSNLFLRIFNACEKESVKNVIAIVLKPRMGLASQIY
jgi:hypothetical protein